jgi:uncharacterized protein with PQ loop repeat
LNPFQSRDCKESWTLKSISNAAVLEEIIFLAQMLKIISGKCAAKLSLC